MNEDFLARVLSNKFEYIDINWLSDNDYIELGEDPEYYITVLKDITLNGMGLEKGNSFTLTVDT